jgi:hypothetical protein
VAAFTELNWRRIDVTTIVTFGGLATVDERRHQACRDWLLREGYEIDTFDCGPGLAVAIPEGGGRVFEVIRPDLAWEEDRRWLCGLLAIAQEHCRQQLAIGRRFFALLVVPEQSPLIGAVVGEVRVPGVYWDPCRELHKFARSSRAAR